MSNWSSAWVKSLATHVGIIILLIGIHLLVTTESYVAKGVKVRISTGSQGGHGQGGRYAAIQSGENIPREDVKERRRVGDGIYGGEKMKSYVDKIFTPLRTNRDTSLGVSDEKFSNEKVKTQFETEGTSNPGSEGLRGSSGKGVADFGSNTGNGGEGAGNSYGSGPFSGSGFYANGDGTYTATSLEGIEYTILKEVYPAYPERARDAMYTSTVVAKAKFIVGLDGSVETVEILNQLPNLGFKEATIKAIKSWRFAPIQYEGVPIKVEFRKQIRFIPN